MLPLNAGRADQSLTDKLQLQISNQKTFEAMYMVLQSLTFFYEVTKSDKVLRGITANVIDSCIEVIIGLPDIRTHRLVHRIPSYFDTPDPSYLDVQVHSLSLIHISEPTRPY